MSDVQVSIGTDNSNIHDSTIKVGNIEAGNHANHVLEVIQKLEGRVIRIEDLLGGVLGSPGLAQELRDMKSDIGEIKAEMQRQYVPPMQRVYLSISTVCLLITIVFWVTTIWR